MDVTIDQLEIEIHSSSTGAAKNIDDLSASLSKLKTSVKGGAGLTTVTNQLKKFSETIRNIQAPTQTIADLVNALNPLQTIGKSNLGSVLNQLKKVPEITNALDDEKIRQFAEKIKEVTIAVQPLATEMEKVSAGFSKLPANIQKAINANAKLTKSNKSTAFGFNMLAMKVGIVLSVFRRVGRVIGGWIEESNNYIENLNLFNISMGEYTESALKYAEQVGEVLSIDPSQFMRYQAVFMNMASGFGIAADKAHLMSRNLTQLGYDLSSVFNVDFNVGMEKLQSALSGQPRPMREWGFDLSEATLKAVALEKGITKNVETMGQMEKAQLRYIQLIETAQELNLTENFSRELITPANQIRVFQAQITQLSRALGNVFIPALSAMLPYAIAFAQVLRLIAESISEMVGFTLPEIDYSGLRSATDIIDDTTDSVENLKNATTGIDELNILTPTNAATELGSGFDLDLPEYDFFAEGIKSESTKIFEDWKAKVGPTIDWFTSRLETIKITVIAIGVGLMAWKIGGGFQGGILTLLRNLASGGLLLLGIAGAVAVIAGISDIWVNGINWGNFLVVLAGIAALTVAIGLSIGWIPALITLIVVAVAFVAVLIVKYWDEIVAFIKDNWKAMLLFLVNPIAGVFKLLYDNFEGFRNVVDNVVGAVKGFFISMWNGIKTGFVTVINGMISGVESFINFFIKGINAIIGAINKIKIDVPDWVPVIGGKKFSFGLQTVQEISLGRIGEFAGGGFPSTGEMFIARESGPEMVGTIGGRTAVANNDQITEGISAAVYNAMVSANASSSNNGGDASEIRIFLDGKEIFATVEKYQRQKGVGGLVYTGGNLSGY